MTDRQLDHLADAAELSFETADILVADLFCPFKPIDIPFLGDLNIGRAGDDTRTFRFDRRYFELKIRIGDAGNDRQNVSRCYREVDQGLGDLLGFGVKVLGHMHRRNEVYTFRFDLFLNRPDHYTVSRIHARVHPRELVDAYLSLFPVGGHGTPDLGDGFCFALNDDELAGNNAELLHGVRIEPCFSRTLILRIRTVDFE